VNNETFIRSYFSGWEKNDWNLVESLLADDFTFTSPNDDDHIDKRRYKRKCWPSAPTFERFNIEKVIENDAEAFAKYEAWTTDGKSFRNAEYFRFRDGKIEEIQVFFGVPHPAPADSRWPER
jgi:ketosteroid isomerase-like protein